MNPSPSSQTFRICTYNLFEGAPTSYNRLIEFVRTAQLDAICLQEVNGWQDNDMQRCKDFGDKILFLDYVYVSSNTEYKLATFTKHAAVAKNVYNEGFWHGAGEVRLSVGAQEITIINLDLDPWKEESRVREVQRLLSALDLTKPIIVTGDFSSLSRADNYPPQLLEDLRKRGISKFGVQELSFDVTDCLQQAGLVDLAAQLKNFETTVPTAFKTGNDHEVPVRVDYMFASPSLAAKVATVEVVKNELVDAISDHYPVVVTFKFGDQPAPAAAEEVASSSTPEKPSEAPPAPQPSTAELPRQEADGSIVLPLHIHDHNA